MKDKDGNTDTKGEALFDGYKGIRTYDWLSDDGYNNMGTWVEEAYERAQNRD